MIHPVTAVIETILKTNLPSICEAILLQLVDEIAILTLTKSGFTDWDKRDEILLAVRAELEKNIKNDA